LDSEKPIESIAIFVIVLINALLGFFQEFRAEKSLQALSRMAPDKAIVRRGGAEKNVDVSSIVPGDIIILEAGDSVPADARIISSVSLKTTEASLTGESNAVDKATRKLAEKTVLAERSNMLYMGTAISNGKCEAVVTETGNNTEFGKIAFSLSTIKEKRTPLQEKFAALARQITYLAGFLILLVFIIGYIEWHDSLGELVLFALVLAVGTVPSALPLIVTFSLSLGAKRLASKNMLLRSLPAAESMGSVDFICTDKTGTLTKNEMTVTHVFTGNQVVQIKGSGYSKDEKLVIQDTRLKKNMDVLSRIALNCNNASINEKNEVIGDPTEAALIVLANKTEVNNKIPRTDEFPFDSDRKRMSIVTEEGEILVKGAPEALLKLSTNILDGGKIRKISEKDRELIQKTQKEFADNALRVLGFAFRKGRPKDAREAEKNLVFVGLAGMQDPPREGVKESISECRSGGIDIMMITGDHITTAKAIASRLGMLENKQCIEGGEIEKWSDSYLLENIGKIAVIARATPKLKTRIVSSLQAKGHIVAMTGDGVNDAPALKNANVGLSMGITGSDVAKEASKGILLDDNFSTIVNAIKEGRSIYDKIIKSTKYLLSCNFGEIVTVLGTLLVFNQLPLQPLQILMINMLTDSAPAAGLGMEKNEDDVMKRPPRKIDEKPITKKKLAIIALFGFIMGSITVAMFGYHRHLGLQTAQTIAFTTLVVMQLFAVLSIRSFKPNLKNLNLSGNLALLGGIIFSISLQLCALYVPLFQTVLGTVPLMLGQWILILGVGFLSYILFESGKLLLPEN